MKHTDIKVLFESGKDYLQTDVTGSERGEILKVFRLLNLTTVRL